MWAADAELIRAYKACYTNVITNMREGEEVDLGGACVQELDDQLFISSQLYAKSLLFR